MRKLLVMFLILTSSVCFAATRQKTWVTGDALDANPLNADWDNFYSEKVTSSNIADGAVGNSQLGTITTAGKINISSFTASGQAQGDILYYNGTAWAKLAAGTANYALVTNGTSANPAFETELGWTKMAWANFTDGTVNDSYNVTSVTAGAGDDTVNFTVAFSNANYCAIATSGIATSGFSRTGSPLVSSIHVLSYNDQGAGLDGQNSILCIGD